MAIGDLAHGITTSLRSSERAAAHHVAVGGRCVVTESRPLRGTGDTPPNTQMEPTRLAGPVPSCRRGRAAHLARWATAVWLEVNLELAVSRRPDLSELYFLFRGSSAPFRAVARSGHPVPAARPGHATRCAAASVGHRRGEGHHCMRERRLTGVRSRRRELPRPTAYRRRPRPPSSPT